MRHTPLAALCVLIPLAGPAGAQQAARNSFFEPSVLSVPAIAAAEPDESNVFSGFSFGEADTQWFSFGTMASPDFMGHYDQSVFAQYTYFLIDDFEVGVEGTFWGFFQDDNTVGVSTSLVMRYHFFQAERWSAFAEAGMGLMIAGDNVPDEGTSFNLMPRFGAGVTWQMFEDSPTRLITGLRWHHISNARITGEEANPARDAPGLYVGLMYQF